MSTRSILPPKIPQTERVDEVYNALKKGLQSCLNVHQTDLDNINKEKRKSQRNSRLGFLYEFDQQAKVIETYIGSLKVHLCKTEEIYEAYLEKRRLRDEANKVVNACKASPGSKEAKESLAKANNDYKKFSEHMNERETELQKQLGEFSIKMKGLAGFARLCAGDQYEILIKFGRQRWKMHGSIEVNAKQTWDCEEMVFFPYIHEFISVKVTELRSLTNHVVVGNIFCEPKDLFAPLAQKVAVDINELGTIKLVLEVTWNPTPGPRPNPTLIPTSPDPSEGSSSGPDIFEPVPLPSPSPSPPDSPLPQNEPDIPLYTAEEVKAKCWPRDGVLVDSGLQDALEILISSLDDYTGHFTDLQELEDELKLLQKTLKELVSVPDGRSNPPPRMGTHIYEEVGQENSRMRSENNRNRVGWINEDLPDQKSPLDNGGWDSPSTPLTTGCTRLDASLVVHLKNCSAQLEHLGVFGPLQMRVTYALDKLLRDARVYKTIHHVIRDDPHRHKDPAEVIPELDQCVGASSLWQQCVGDDCLYCVSTERFMSTLFTLYSGFLCERADTVLLCLVERVLEQRLAQRGRRDEPVVTLFQLWNYLESNGINDVESHIIALAEEVDLVQNLLSRDQDVITETLHLPSECSLKREGLKTIAKLLTDPREKVLASASSVLRILAGQHKQREQALLNCLEMLEDDDVDTRVCGCKALACLKATESIEQLMYLCENDNDDVQEAAMQTLLELGDEGKTALRRLGMSQDIIPDSPLPDSWPDRPSTSAYEHQSGTAY